MLLAHLSDTHLLADPNARMWGHNPFENLSAVMDALPPRVDALVVTGDIAEDGSREAYRLASELTAGRAMQRFFIAGNHDDPAEMDAVLGRTEDVRIERLSDDWTIGLVNSQWIGHDAGCITETTLARLNDRLARTTTHVVLCVHHPPLSPCANADCGMESAGFIDALRGTSVRMVLSGHVHQKFETTRQGVTFLGAPSTFRQLRHGGNSHYTDTGEPAAAHLLELRDDGDVRCRVVSAG